MEKLILASASPRRRELIKLISDNVICVPSGEEEALPDGILATETAQFLAYQKAKSVARDYPSDFVVGCDTVVILQDTILSKPKDEADAYNKLSTLSGKKHKVITGCAIIKGDRIHTFSQETQVEFYPLSDEEIRRYIDTKDPMDKAGAYGIQGAGSLFVKGIEGDYFNVVGLPVARLMRELKAFGYR